jgi:hypothetical protein
MEMNFLPYFLASIVVFAGLIVGVFIRKFTKEEFEPGKKYFILTQRVLMLVIVFFVMFLLDVQFIWIIAALFVVSTAMYQLNLKLPVYYVILGFIFFISSQAQNVFLVTAGLSFLFGFPSGTLIEKDKVVKIVLMSLLFFAAAWILFFTGFLSG